MVFPYVICKQIHDFTWKHQKEESHHNDDQGQGDSVVAVVGALLNSKMASHPLGAMQSFNK